MTALDDSSTRSGKKNAGSGQSSWACSSGSKAVVRGRLRVNVDATFGHHVLAPQIGEFLDRYPELSIEIGLRDRMGDLVADGFDVAIRFGEPEPSSLKARLLPETRVLTCASVANLARHGTPQHPRDLTQGNQCLLLRDPSTGRPFEWEFQNGTETIPLAAPGRLMVNDTGSLLGACLGGAGIAQLLELS
jgi:DNA-binding transcriptional LysR family regulator